MTRGRKCALNTEIAENKLLHLLESVFVPQCKHLCIINSNQKNNFPNPVVKHHEEQWKLYTVYKKPGDSVAKFLWSNPPKKSTLNSCHLLRSLCWQTLCFTSLLLHWRPRIARQGPLTHLATQTCGKTHVPCHAFHHFLPCKCTIWVVTGDRTSQVFYFFFSNCIHTVFSLSVQCAKYIFRLKVWSGRVDAQQHQVSGWMVAKQEANSWQLSWNYTLFIRDNKLANAEHRVILGC